MRNSLPPIDSQQRLFDRRFVSVLCFGIQKGLPSIVVPLTGEKDWQLMRPYLIVPRNHVGFPIGAVTPACVFKGSITTRLWQSTTKFRSVLIIMSELPLDIHQ
jgi:hypothetical protein